MNFELQTGIEGIDRIRNFILRIKWERVIVIFSLFLAVIATYYSFSHDLIIAYGDAESHLNIAKRVVQGLTPGFAQLGGVWLPLPHILMIPFVIFDPLWRSGLAGSIVSGIAFIVTGMVLYKMTMLLTNNIFASLMTYLAFALNPNILYLQTTPMTELPLLAFFVLSGYYFIKYLKNDRKVGSHLLAGFFGFCAALSRYDGWFLVLFESMVIVVAGIAKHEDWGKIEGKYLVFSTLGYFAVGLWFVWDFIILGDPLYFTNSKFSAHAQQLNWLHKGELPAYHNPILSFLYYLVTSMSDTGIIIFGVSVIGLLLFLSYRKQVLRYLIAFVLFIPFLFNVIALYTGQSVIFIPHLTPVGFEWRLFNVRYGVLMIPVFAFFFGYAFYRIKKTGVKILILVLFVFQFLLYGVGYSKVMTLADGTSGLSRAKRPDAEYFMKEHYDHGLVLLDDYARTLSIIRSGIPMQDVIYVGNKPYWQESLVDPERYATWIIMQKNDDVWKHIYENPAVRGRLYKYFQKVYTSPQILIFKKTS